VFRPLRWIVLLLVAAGLWIVMLVIPTPADVDHEHSYFSPLPATAFMYFFRLNAPLLGWHPWFPTEKYKMSFSSAKSIVPERGCVRFSGMYLEIAPRSLWGSFVHWEVGEIGICGEPD
jgi:hypothetical protein